MNDMKCFQFFIAIAMMCFSFQQSYAQKVLKEQDTSGKTLKVRGKKFKPTAPKPVFEGAFSVGVILIDFPDTQIGSIDQVKEGLFNFGPMTVKEYFKEYSQNKAWPQMLVIGEDRFPKSVYRAPHPFGYYCDYDYWSNPLGFKSKKEGQDRAKKLRAAALKYAFRFYKKPAKAEGVSLKSNGKPHVVCYAYTTKLKTPLDFKKHIAPFYEKHKKNPAVQKETYEYYDPKVPWGDPLWPNSIPQVFVEGGGGTFAHELGHVLGAPDFYHAPEINDGTPGTPCLAWAYGPTGPAYCRFVHNGFLYAVNYPILTKSGTYKLYPRMTNPAGDKPVGFFIPSFHSHYVFYVEYVKGEKAPLGNPGEKGLIVHVINRTMTSPLFGSPDLCYTYRPNDPWFRSGGDLDQALLGPGHSRSSFSPESNPSSRLPNLLDSGLTIDNIKESDDGVQFDLKLTKKKPLSQKEYIRSLVPKIKLEEVSEIQPTSFHAKCNVTYRGEPLKTEYGFCWSTRKNPKVSSSKKRSSRGTGQFPLYHRDRYTARILGLKPKTKYYVRAYARSALGISYSEEEIVVETPEEDKGFETVGPLLEDQFSGNWTIRMYHDYGYTKDDFFIGCSAITTLMKLTNYYRLSFQSKTIASLSKGKKTKKSKRPRKTETKKTSAKIDYTRVHSDPSLGKPPKRLIEYYDIMAECDAIASQTGMEDNIFPKNFNAKFAYTFGLKSQKRSKNKPVEVFSKDNFESYIPRIKEQLIKGIPVIVVQESDAMSPDNHVLSWVIIDGYNSSGQFHIDYPRGKDRVFKRKSGWHELEILLEDVRYARIIFGLTPPGFKS